MKFTNPKAWALCRPTIAGWAIRKIVWGRLLARAEKRAGETIMQVRIEPAPIRGAAIAELPAMVGPILVTAA